MRVSAGSAGPGFGCQCPSSLKQEQILAAMGRAALVTIEYQKTEMDGTLVFRTWTDPENIYLTTFNPKKPGKICKHGIAVSAYIVGDWFTDGLTQLREEQAQCRQTKKDLKALQRMVIRLEKKQAPPSDTS